MVDIVPFNLANQILGGNGYLLAWGPDAGGQFTFKITTAAFKKLTRTDTWRWVTQERINNDPAEQYVGRGSKNITLEGVIYASYNPGAGLGVLAETPAVGTHVLDVLRLIADQGQPGTMVDGRGNVLGQWVLVGIREEQEYFLSNGAPQKQTFAIEFRSYSPDNPLATVPLPPALTVTAGNIDPAFQPLANATNAATGQLATTMQDAFGNTSADAKDMAQFLYGLGNALGKIVQDTLAGLAQALAAGLNLRGQDFKAMAVNLTNTAGATTFKDWDSVVGQGLPAITSALSTNLGIGGNDAAANVAAIFATLDQRDGDRGDTMKELGNELAFATNSDALKNLGVNFNDQSVPPVDRYASALQKMADLQNNPATQAQLTAALPPATYPTLYDQAAQKAEGHYDSAVAAVTNGGLATSTPYIGHHP